MDVAANSATDKSLMSQKKVKITLFAFRVLEKAGSLFQQPDKDNVGCKE